MSRGGGGISSGSCKPLGPILFASLLFLHLEKQKNTQVIHNAAKAREGRRIVRIKAVVVKLVTLLGYTYEVVGAFVIFEFVLVRFVEASDKLFELSNFPFKLEVLVKFAPACSPVELPGLTLEVEMEVFVVSLIFVV